MKKTSLIFMMMMLVIALGAQGSMDQYQLETAEDVELVEVPHVDDPLGREVARYGTMESIRGELRFENGEWYLAGDDVTYELHMGPAGHDTDDLFEQGSRADVRGFVYRDHIAPVLIESTSGPVSFWDEGRYPLWAGSGNRVQQTDMQGTNETAQPYLQRVSVQGERGNPVFLQQDLFQRAE